MKSTNLAELPRETNSEPYSRELKIDERDVKNKYNAAPEIWPKDDKWHSYVHASIDKYIRQFYRRSKIDNNTVILNAGSGGITYGLPQKNMIHMDVADTKISHFPHYIVGSVESIPMEDNSVDLCICVGSVVNYCDVKRVISEFKRILRPGGTMVIEFETTLSLDLPGTEEYDQDAVIIETFYNHHREVIWIYSQRYIESLLRKNGFRFHHHYYFHIIAPLLYRLTHNVNFAASFTFIDGLLRRIPGLRNHCSNVIMTCEKV